MSTPTSARRAPSARTQAKHRAVARNEKVVLDAGKPGVVLAPGQLWPHEFRTDLVEPVLSFVVYGVPAPQGSKNPTMRSGKIIMQESSAGVDPWRKNVRQVALMAIQEHTKRTKKPWRAINEPVMVTLALTLPSSKARAGETWAATIPDLDKLERAVGDALAPVPLKPSDGAEYAPSQKKAIRAKLMEQRRTVSVLHDDSLIAAWGNPHKTYPATVSDSLSYPGAAVQVYRLADLDRARAVPTKTNEAGENVMRADDFARWARHGSGERWPDLAARLWRDPAAVMASSGPAIVRGRTIDDDAARYAARVLATEGPDGWVRVTFAQAPTSAVPPRP